jgi:hypothetical protein
MAKLLSMKMGTLLTKRTWQNSQLRKWGGGEKILFKIMGFFILRKWENSKL